MNRFLILLLGLFSLSVYAQDIDYLSLAEVLLKDGNHTRAKSALNKAKKEWEYVDRQSYHLLYGLYWLRIKNFKFAILELKKVSEIDLNFKKNLYLSEAYIKNNNPRKALHFIGKVSMNYKSPQSFKHLKAKILFENGKIKQAISLLDSKGHIFHSKSEKILIHYLMKLNLYEAAFVKILSLLNKENKPESYIYMAQLLISKGMQKKAITLLEKSMLYFPDNTELLKLLAGNYNLLKMKYIAGDLYSKLAYLNQDYAKLAADYLNQNGRFFRATVINMSIKDPKKKLTQKLAFYIARERFDLAYSLEKSLSRYNIFKDDEIKYAIAYTNFIQGNYKKSLNLLQNIKKKTLLSKSVKLMKIVNDCQPSPWECYGIL